MAGKVVINLASGAEDAEAARFAVLVGTDAQAPSNDVVAFLTKEAAGLEKPGSDDVHAAGAPPPTELAAQFADRAALLYLCPVCVRSRSFDDAPLAAKARVKEAAALWEWIGDGGAVYRY